MNNWFIILTPYKNAKDPVSESGYMSLSTDWNRLLITKYLMILNKYLDFTFSYAQT